ncbi:hypothetical protein SBV1_2200034 [Verrucomicrobia bacterium]|nr:hypothetical protein SBV1_2200034 [Verrucomicrobiota bacterium]
MRAGKKRDAFEPGHHAQFGATGRQQLLGGLGFAAVHRLERSRNIAHGLDNIGSKTTNASLKFNVFFYYRLH